MDYFLHLMPGHSPHKGFVLGDRDLERGHPSADLAPLAPQATLWGPHSLFLWVARVGDVGLTKAGSHVGVGERGEAVCIDLYVQRLQD